MSARIFSKRKTQPAMPTEADTCRKFVVPKLQAAGSDSELDALQAEVDALKRLQAETVAELDALLPAILDRAFKGEL